MVGRKKQQRRGEKQHILKRIQGLKTWQLVMIFTLLVFLSATFLRLNNIGMIQRRDAVLSADEKAGNGEVTKERLYALQRYASAHMNADTGVVYLQGSFDRDWEKIKKKAEKQNNQGGANIYEKIEREVCGPMARANGWRWPDPRYISCQRKELEKYPGGNTLVNQVDPPDKELYRHSFVSPTWSPDFAGFSVLVTLLVALAIILRVLTAGVLQIVLRLRD